MRALGVGGLAGLEELREPCARIGRGEQGPARVVASALPEALQARTQIDHCSRLVHQGAVRLIEEYGAAGGDHRAFLSRQLGEQRRLAPAESLLALDLEDRGYRGGGALDELAIGVDELAPQALRERPAERRLAGAHHAHEKDIRARHNRPVALPGSGIAEKKAPADRGWR